MLTSYTLYNPAIKKYILVVGNIPTRRRDVSWVDDINKATQYPSKCCAEYARTQFEKYVDPGVDTTLVLKCVDY